MTEIDDLEIDFATPRSRRPYRRRNGQCEAIGLRGRCGRGATTMRDDRKVCRQHAEADYPLAYYRPPTDV